MPGTIELVKKLGLNEYESRTYLALAGLGDAPVSSISKSAAIPRARAYDVLLSLENKGFVQKKPVRPLSYTALSPGAVFKNLERKKSEKFRKEVNELNGIRKSLESQLSSPKMPASSNGVWLVEGRDNIYQRIAKQLENAKESIVISSTPGGIERKRRAFSGKLTSLSKKGVKLSYAPGDDSRFIVFDKKSALLFLNNDNVDEKQEKALVINSPFVANFLGSLKGK